MTNDLKELSDDIKNEVKESIRERFKVPIVFVYALLLLLYHWEILLVVFTSTYDPVYKIFYIKSNFLKDPYADILTIGILAVLVTLIFPIIQIGINIIFQYFKNFEINRIHNENIENAKNARKVTVIKSGTDKLEELQSYIDILSNERKELFDKAKDLNAKLEKQRAETAGYKKRCTELETDNGSYMMDLAKLSEEFNKLQTSIHPEITKEILADIQHISNYILTNYGEDILLKFDQMFRRFPDEKVFTIPQYLKSKDRQAITEILEEMIARNLIKATRGNYQVTNSGKVFFTLFIALISRGIGVFKLYFSL